MLKNFPGIVMVGILLAGCAAGGEQEHELEQEHEHEYRDAGASFATTTSKTVAVAVQDKRNYVVRGDRPASFAGTSRGMVSRPQDISTASGLPLAGDMASSIAAGLKRRGVTAFGVAVSPGDSDAAAQKTLLAAKADRFVLLTLHEWKADITTNAFLHFIVRLRVFDRKGKELAAKDLQGRDDLAGGSVLTAQSREAVAEAYRLKLEALFNDPAIVAALK